MFIKYTILTASLLSLIACTHTPSLGEQMVADSESTRQMGKNWNEGEKSVSDAAKLTKNGGKLIKTGNKNINTGNKLVSKGEQQVSQGNFLLKQAKNKNQQGHALQLDSEQQYKEKSTPQ